MECGVDHRDLSFKSVKLGVGWTAIHKKRAMFPKLQKVNSKRWKTTLGGEHFTLSKPQADPLAIDQLALSVPGRVECWLGVGKQ